MKDRIINSSGLLTLPKKLATDCGIGAGSTVYYQYDGTTEIRLSTKESKFNSSKVSEKGQICLTKEALSFMGIKRGESGFVHIYKEKGDLVLVGWSKLLSTMDFVNLARKTGLSYVVVDPYSIHKEFVETVKQFDVDIESVESKGSIPRNDNRVFVDMRYIDTAC